MIEELGGGVYSVSYIAIGGLGCGTKSSNVDNNGI
jgi:hypothetical protein